MGGSVEILKNQLAIQIRTHTHDTLRLLNTSSGLVDVTFEKFRRCVRSRGVLRYRVAKKHRMP